MHFSSDCVVLKKCDVIKACTQLGNLKYIIIIYYINITSATRFKTF